jgi:hypothetical protein
MLLPAPVGDPAEEPMLPVGPHGDQGHSALLDPGGVEGRVQPAGVTEKFAACGTAISFP